MKGKGTNPSAPAGDDLIEIDFVDVDRECPHFKHGKFAKLIDVELLTMFAQP